MDEVLSLRNRSDSQKVLSKHFTPEKQIRRGCLRTVLVPFLLVPFLLVPFLLVPFLLVPFLFDRHRFRAYDATA
jgi:hypothetical protein